MGLPVNAFLESRPRFLWWVCLAGLAFVALNAMRSLPQIQELFLAADGDDQMRLVVVRDWLAGQSWWDTHQYRVLPPEGISMHWSRYIDAGIAAILVPASWVLPPDRAALATVILWPSLLAALMVLVIAHGAGRLFGAAGAIGALAVFFSWGKLGGEVVPPRIDHHNAQILFSTAVFYLSLVPGRARLLGILAGVMTAAALAVGIEMLPALATIWGIVALRHAYGQSGTGDWLLGFGPAFLLAALLLFFGQTPPAEWLALHCDELAPPVILFGVIGAVATAVPVLAGQVLRGPAARILAMAAITGLGLWLAFPLLGQCLRGPFANVAPEVRAIIEANIAEALPALTVLQSKPETGLSILLPMLVIGILALAAAWLLWGRLGPAQRMALIQSFIVLLLGLAFASLQIRAANLATPALPLLAGFLLYGFLQIPRASTLRIPAVIALLVAQPTVLSQAATLFEHAAPLPTTATATAEPVQANLHCRTVDDLAKIAKLPPSTIFSTLNMGPTILAFTPQSVTSAGYHRNAQAFWNGLGAFQSIEILRGALLKSRADYLVLCRGDVMENGSPLLQDMLAGVLPVWLADVTSDAGALRVLQIDKTALQAIEAQP